MKIFSAEYQKSFKSVSTIDLPNLPAIAFIGRSNVGKSSLINNLTNRKKLVKTSATPGKTQMINFFLINNAFYIVDLPGYGFAQVPKKIRLELSAMIRDFISDYDALKLVFQLVDIRHEPSGDDIHFYQHYSIYNTEYQIIANKSDKITTNQRATKLKAIKNSMQATHEIIDHSIKDKGAKRTILNRMNSIVTR